MENPITGTYKISIDKFNNPIRIQWPSAGGNSRILDKRDVIRENPSPAKTAGKKNKNWRNKKIFLNMQTELERRFKYVIYKTLQHVEKTIDKWTSQTKYVDIDTGEEITRWNAEINYINIKNTKHVTIDKELRKGTIQWTRECKRNPQRRLFE